METTTHVEQGTETTDNSQQPSNTVVTQVNESLNEPQLASGFDPGSEKLVEVLSDPSVLDNVTNLSDTEEVLVTVVLEEKEPELTADEKIISDWLANGKTQVSMNELITAGFDAEEIHPHSFTIGRFKLSRILLVSPYNIEKTEKK